MKHAETRGDIWERKASEHPVLEGAIMVVALFIAFMAFILFGYLHLAAYGEPAAPEREVLVETNPDDSLQVGIPLKITKAKEVLGDESEQEVPDLAEGTGWEPGYSDSPVPIEVGGDYVSDFKAWGGGSDGTYTYTWYSQRVLPGDGLDALNGNGRHVEEDGFVHDGDGYIAVALDGVDEGSVISTPWGEAKVYDRVHEGEYTGHVDVYTDY